MADNTIVIERIGDFYENTDDMAQLVGKALDLPVGTKGAGKTPVVGFLYYMGESVFDKLTEQYNLFIMESTQEKCIPGKQVGQVEQETGDSVKYW